MLYRLAVAVWLFTSGHVMSFPTSSKEMTGFSDTGEIEFTFNIDASTESTRKNNMATPPGEITRNSFESYKKDTKHPCCGHLENGEHIDEDTTENTKQDGKVNVKVHEEDHVGKPDDDYEDKTEEEIEVVTEEDDAVHEEDYEQSTTQESGHDDIPVQGCVVIPAASVKNILKYFIKSLNKNSGQNGHANLTGEDITCCTLYELANGKHAGIIRVTCYKSQSKIPETFRTEHVVKREVHNRGSVEHLILRASRRMTRSLVMMEEDEPLDFSFAPEHDKSEEDSAKEEEISTSGITNTHPILYYLFAAQKPCCGHLDISPDLVHGGKYKRDTKSEQDEQNKNETSGNRKIIEHHNHTIEMTTETDKQTIHTTVSLIADNNNLTLKPEDTTSNEPSTSSPDLATARVDADTQDTEKHKLKTPLAESSTQPTKPQSNNGAGQSDDDYDMIDWLTLFN